MAGGRLSRQRNRTVTPDTRLASRRTIVEATPLPEGVDPSDLQTAVRERYAQVASEPDERYPFRVGRAFAEALGYPPELLDSVPESAIEAFTGVATPMLRADLHPGETVVDLGCGGGLDLALAARAVGPAGRAIGIDMAGPMVSRAQRTLRQLAFWWGEAREGRAEALPLDDASADCIVANGILNLSPDKSAVLSEIARVLKPGGRLVVAETTLRHALPPDYVRDLEGWFT
jgi:arsenite methyltransferase